MTPTLSAGRDRVGHAAMCTAIALLLSMLVPSAAAAADYMARRFDVTAVVTDAGGLEVTEAITFDFQSGTFKRVWRDIPGARTDGIDIVEARMDGTVFPRGEGPGRISVSGRNRIRVEWSFPPVGPSVHTFELRYLARGVAYRDGGQDVVRWRLLPTEHRYAIAATRGWIRTPAGPAAPPAVESRRVGSVTAAPREDGVEILASAIRSNGWIIADLRFPAGTVVTATPQWQQRNEHARALAPRWMIAAGALFAFGVLLLTVMRQGYPAPSVSADETTTTSPPEALPAALAAVLAAKGGTSGYQAAATLIDLADRGILTVRELPRTLGTRSYELSQVPGAHPLADHEAEAIRIAFAGRGDAVSFSKARARLTRASRRFNAAVNADLARRGLLDPERKAIRDRLMIAAVILLVAGGLGCIAAAPFIQRFLAWPMLLPLALVLAGIAGLVMAASATPLSDQGLISAAGWQGFRRHLKAIADARETRGAGSVDPRWIVYGIGLGLGVQWAKFLRRHPEAAPPWFVAAAQGDQAAFAAFVGSHAASSGGHGGGGGGAAGGGGSGAG